MFGILVVRQHVSNEINALKTTAVPTRAPGMLQSITYTVHVDSFCHYAFESTRLVSSTEVRRCSLGLESFWNIPIETKSDYNNRRKANTLIY